MSDRGRRYGDRSGEPGRTRERTFAVDLHAHTRFFHWPRGRPTPYDPIGARLLAPFARRRDLDGVALTNHDYCRFDGDGDGDGAGSGLTFVPGIEVSTTAGHVLVVGPDPPRRTGPGAPTPAEVVASARDRGCAAIIAHPYRNSVVRESSASFDAVEVNGKDPQSLDRTRDLADEREVPVVGGSDAHFPFEVGRVYTRVEADELTPASVVAAIRDGRVSPRLASRFPDRLIREAYRRVHRYRGGPFDE